MKKVQKIFFTTVALTLTSFLMKTVAVWFNVYLTGKIGSAGIGLFQLILSLYAMGKTFAASGMNLAATRICIDDSAHMRGNLNRLFGGAFLIGAAAFLALFFLSGPLTIRWIDEERAATPLKILSLALPFLAVTTALNGYMTAVRKMTRFSVIQLIEQIVRIAFTVWIIALFGASGTDKTLSLVCAGIAVSEVSSFFLSLLCYRRALKRTRARKEKGNKLLQKILRIAVPDALGAYLRSALSTVEHLLIPIGILRSGADKEKALSEYGTVQGMALPVVLYPSSVFGVISGLLVPEIAE